MLMRNLMAERYPIYAEADITVESRDVPHEVIVKEVIEAVAVRLGCHTTRTKAPRSDTVT